MKEAKGMRILRPSLPWAALAGALVLIVGLTPTVLAQSQSSDATLSGLTLSDVDFGTFASGTTSYTASVASTVTQTTVTPTPNHSSASYVIKLGGVEDDDGVIQLAAGDNIITVEVTAEDRQTTQTYTVTVTRPASTDATLSSLTLSGIGFGTFASDTISYQVTIAAGSVLKTTVSATVNHPAASYTITRVAYENNYDFTPDRSASISIFEGNNVFAVTVTAEDDTTTKTYTVTVTSGQPLTVLGIANQDWPENLNTSGVPYWAQRNEADFGLLVDVTWSLTGADSDYFSITKDEFNYGGLNFKSPPDYETPTDANTDNVYEVTVNASDSDGNQATHDVRVTVTDVEENATGAPTISGTAQVGQTLTAITTGISDSDGLTNVTYSYQWLADDAEISGATSSTYTVQSSDNGKVIKVRVTFTDDANNEESLTSAGTSAVVLGGL